MRKLPRGTYTTEFRLEAVKPVSEGALAQCDARQHLSLPMKMPENWVEAAPIWPTPRPVVPKDLDGPVARRAHTNGHFDALGLPHWDRCVDLGLPRYGAVCPMVTEGRRRDASP